MWWPENAAPSSYEAVTRTNVFQFRIHLYMKSHDSSVGIALGYELDDWDSRV
jgi:hypothetical protein